MTLPVLPSYLGAGEEGGGDVGQVLPLPLPPLLGEEREKQSPNLHSGPRAAFASNSYR